MTRTHTSGHKNTTQKKPARTGPRYRWAPGAGAFLREAETMQFGVDGTRVGIVETPKAAELVDRLRAIDAPLTREEWFAASGLDSSAARSLFDDLVDYGILRDDSPRGTIVLVGDSPLAGEISSLCAASNIEIRRPLRGESLTGFLEEVPPETPVIAVNCHDQTHRLAAALAESHAVTWLPVRCIDNRGFVGPLRLDGRGPCPLCADLHRADTDPSWNVILRQFKEHLPHFDPLTLAATAVQAVHVIRTLINYPIPPGSSRPSVMAGEFYDVDVYGRLQQRLIDVHPHCPVCFHGTQAAWGAMGEKPFYA